MTPKEALLQASLDLHTIAMAIPNENTIEYNLKVIEERTIYAALKAFKSKTAAAAALGISVCGLEMKLKRMKTKDENRN